MKAHTWEHRRGLLAATCGTVIFALVFVPGFVKAPLDAIGWFICGVFYAVFSLLVYWLFARRTAEPRTVDPHTHPKRSGRVLAAGVALIAGPLVSLGFWALDVYVVRPEFHRTLDQQMEALPDFLVIGVFVGIVVSALVVVLKRD